MGMTKKRTTARTPPVGRQSLAKRTGQLDEMFDVKMSPLCLVEMPTRLERHNAGSTPATRRYRPWLLAWHCTFPDKNTATAFETYLKSASGRAFLHKRLIS